MTTKTHTSWEYTATKWYNSKCWLMTCLIQVLILIPLVIYIALDPYIKFTEILVNIVDSCIFFIIVIEAIIRVIIFKKGVFKSYWFISDITLIVLYMIVFSFILAKGLNLLDERFEIFLLCLRLILQICRFILVSLAFKKTLTRRKVLQDSKELTLD